MGKERAEKATEEGTKYSAARFDDCGGWGYCEAAGMVRVNVPGHVRAGEVVPSGN
jgi:hypothetical protein